MRFNDLLHPCQVKSHDYVKDSEQCRPIIIETLRFLYELDMDDRREVDMSNPIARPRIPHEVGYLSATVSLFTDYIINCSVISINVSILFMSITVSASFKPVTVSCTRRYCFRIL